MIIYQSNKVTPYVYLGVHKRSKKFYIGSRLTTNRRYPSHQDIFQYKTSSKLVRPIFDEFDWTIVAEFFDPDSAFLFEQELIKEHWDDPLLLNQQYREGNKGIFHSAGLTRSKRHKQAISDAQRLIQKTQTQRNVAASNMRKLNKIKVCCLCCKKERDIANHSKHINGITNKGRKVSTEQKIKLSNKKKEQNGRLGPIRGLYIVNINNQPFLCYDLWKFFEHNKVSPPTGRQKFSSKRIGSHRKRNVVAIDDKDLLSLPVID